MLQLSFCYQELEEFEAATNALEEILKDNPLDIELSNDLGYTWADAGKHLDRAEKMIRLAVGDRPRTLCASEASTSTSPLRSSSSENSLISLPKRPRMLPVVI